MGERNERTRALATLLAVVGLLVGTGCLAVPEPQELRAAIPPPPEVPGELIWGGWHRVPVDPALSDSLMRAHRLDTSGRRRDAILVLNEALETTPDSPGLHEARAALCAAVGFMRGAAAEFETATELDPERADAWAALGRMRMELGLATGAIAALERAHALGANDPGLHLSWARALRRKRQRGPAATHYVRTLEQIGDPTTELLIEAASLYYEAREATAAALERACAELGIESQGLQASLVRALLEDRGRIPGVETAYLRSTRVDRGALRLWTRAVLLAVERADERPRQ